MASINVDSAVAKVAPDQLGAAEFKSGAKKAGVYAGKATVVNMAALLATVLAFFMPVVGIPAIFIVLIAGQWWM